VRVRGVSVPTSSTSPTLAEITKGESGLLGCKNDMKIKFKKLYEEQK